MRIGHWASCLGVSVLALACADPPPAVLTGVDGFSAGVVDQDGQEHLLTIRAFGNRAVTIPPNTFSAHLDMFIDATEPGVLPSANLLASWASAAVSQQKLESAHLALHNVTAAVLEYDVFDAFNKGLARLTLTLTDGGRP